VREQRQRPRFVTHILQQQIDQAGLKGPTTLLSRPLNRSTQFLGAHRADKLLMCCQRPAQVIELGAVGIEVRPEGDDDEGGNALSIPLDGMGKASSDQQVVYEGTAFCFTATQSEQLLELVNHE
jgi:hypothetical protein